MKTSVRSLVVMVWLAAGPAWANPSAPLPGKPPSATASYTGRIKAIGPGTLDLHVLRGHSGIIHPVNVDKKTEVVLLGGKAGTLSDLKVGQWIHVYSNTDPNHPDQQRIVKIEPGMAPWAAERLAELEASVGAVRVGVVVFIDGKNNIERLDLIGPDHPKGFPEQSTVHLSKDELLKVLRHMAYDGFLADAWDSKPNSSIVGAQPPHPPAPPYLMLSAGKYHGYVPWGPEAIQRLAGLKTALGQQAAQKLDGLLAKVRTQVAAAKKSR